MIMRKMRIEVVPAKPATTREVVDSVHCDLCGREIMDFGGNFDEIKIERSVGYRYPDCGNSETTSYDVCPACFESEIVPIFGDTKPNSEECHW